MRKEEKDLCKLAKLNRFHRYNPKYRTQRMRLIQNAENVMEYLTDYRIKQLFYRHYIKGDSWVEISCDENIIFDTLRKQCSRAVKKAVDEMYAVRDYAEAC